MKMILIMILIMTGSYFQNPRNPSDVQPPQVKVLLYYFHPNERCPIDQTIEESARKLVSSDFSSQVKNGTFRFQVLNTDDKATAKIAGQFEINTQALYIVTFDKGREVSRKDLTEFAFSNAQSNPARFRSGLKEEITRALTQK